MQIALDLLKKAATQGTWLCLKNLHLVTPWLTTLEKVADIHSDPHLPLSLCLPKGTECIETEQRLSSLVNIGRTSKVSYYIASIEYQDHLWSSTGCEEKSSPNLWNLDAGGIQPRQCHSLTSPVSSRLVSCDCSRTTEIYSTGELLRLRPKRIEPFGS